MKILELFSGTGTLSRIARDRGHEAFTIDLFEDADLQADVLELTLEGILEATSWEGVDMVWASPPCTGFSVASIGRSWHKNGGVYTPKSDTAKLGLELLDKTFDLIHALHPVVWYVENPRGMMRRMSAVQGHARATVTYCQYGETRMKPTDIWHHSPLWSPRPACRNGDPCHESAPRGARTGTQGIKGARDRGKLPDELCVEVIEAAEKWVAQ